ncbi:uncharacterized protein LOC129729138 [Wyeomyia smithii]|uniref:uncharacterized protein LOC129729138 n=1 Tax=Wyeomyia smithii TaxID=174621 RepID=UPI002467CB80|nr:uncharacterized protein LOC129729138 [Wyeomyia smithii]XP_055543603.1 uncharacterized protein LOC129729138 [Wyeomyia smithii]
MQDLVKINDKHYIVDIRQQKSTPDDGASSSAGQATMIQCSVFDLVQLWSETIAITDLIEREKRTNSIVQYSAEIISETMLARKADDFSITHSESNGCEMCLRLKYYVSGIPVTFSMKLEAAGQEQVSQHVLLPVWRSLLVLYEENCALRNMLLKKDIEIDQYKLEGAVLKRNLVATAKFDEAKFDSTFPLTIPEEGLKVRELIKPKERRGNLMKLLQIECRQVPAETASPGKLTLANALTPTRKSPGGRAKGLSAIFAKQRVPKSLSTSSSSLKRLQSGMADDDDKDDVLEKDNSCFDISLGKDLKIRKITKL